MPKPNEVKAALEAAVIQALSRRLATDARFIDATLGFSFTSALSVDEFVHPSVVACCERAPLLQDDLLLYELPLEIFITTLARGDDFVTTHNNRVAAVQMSFGENGDDMILDIQGLDPRFTVHRLEAGESENFTDNIHWVDKQPFTVYAQFNL